jgi:hypothetical protein
MMGLALASLACSLLAHVRVAAHGSDRPIKGEPGRECFEATTPDGMHVSVTFDGTISY